MTCKIKSAGGGGGLALASDPHLGGCRLDGSSENSSDKSNILPEKRKPSRAFLGRPRTLGGRPHRSRSVDRLLTGSVGLDQVGTILSLWRLSCGAARVKGRSPESGHDEIEMRTQLVRVAVLRCLSAGRFIAGTINDETCQRVTKREALSTRILAESPRPSAITARHQPWVRQPANWIVRVSMSLTAESIIDGALSAGWSTACSRCYTDARYSACC